MRLILLAFLIFVSACKDTQADADVGLYDPVPPEGSAFVRFINLQESSVVPSANGKKYDALDKGQVSAYYVVPEGIAKISMFSQEIEENITAGEFYSFVSGENLLSLVDTANDNRSKATIAAYNFSDKGQISLKAKGGSIDVLNVESNKTQARDINAVKIDFSLYNGDKELASLGDEVIERGNHYSIIYDGDEVQMITATTNTRK